MKIGDIVKIRESDSSLDCCAGKRGQIAHIGVGGGFLLNTDHFCPIERNEEELEVIPAEVLAQEVLDEASPQVREEYMNADIELLREYASVDKKAAAVLVLRDAAMRIE